MGILSVENGIVSLSSRYSVPETLDRLETLVSARGMTVFARIDQAAAAQRAGLTLRPTQLLLFGDPKTGTTLMDAFPSLALDLPLKALAWEDEDGVAWLTYNSPVYLQQRHGLSETPFAALGTLMENVVQ